MNMTYPAFWRYESRLGAVLTGRYDFGHKAGKLRAPGWQGARKENRQKKNCRESQLLHWHHWPCFCWKVRKKKRSRSLRCSMGRGVKCLRSSSERGTQTGWASQASPSAANRIARIRYPDLFNLSYSARLKAFQHNLANRLAALDFGVSGAEVLRVDPPGDLRKRGAQ